MDSGLVKQVIEKVYPGKAVVEMSSPPFVGAGFFVVPGKTELRWIVPESWRYGRAFVKDWRPFDLDSRLKWQVLQLAYKVGMLAKIPRVKCVVVAEPDQSWQHVGWDLPEPPVPVIYLGSPGRTRKAVIGLVGQAECRLVACAKIPIGPAASDIILREMDILAQLAVLKPGMAPTPLFCNLNSGIVVQQAVQGVPTGKKLTHRHISWLLDFSTSDEGISMREVAQTVATYAEHLVSLDREARSIIEQTCATIDDSTLLPAVWAHGDFAPWNLKIALDGRLTAVDWEHSFARALPLFDIVYFRSVQMLLFGEKQLFPRYTDPLIRSYLDGLGLAPKLLNKLVLACLLLDWSRQISVEDDKRADFLISQIRNSLQLEK